MNSPKKTCVSCFRMLADATRLQIIKCLRDEGAHNVSALTKILNVTQPTVSHHLSLLSRADLITKRRAGREVRYAFNPCYPCRGCGVFGAPVKLL